MKKEELVYLHTLLAQFKEFCEEKSFDCEFTKYKELGIPPSDLHRSKEEHKQAIFVLASELASMAAKKPKREEARTKTLRGNFERLSWQRDSSNRPI